MRFKSLAAAVSMMALTGAAPSPQRAPEFSPDRVKAHVTFLSDDLLEGRDSGEPGYDIAALYVATRFAALGLEPAANGSWYQQVPFQESSLQGTPALTIGGTSFANGENVLIGPSATEAAQSISAPVVFAGYGLDAPGQGFDDYAGLDVKGKVVAVLSGYPKGAPSELGAHLSREKARMAAAHGAIGIVDILTPAALETRPWERRAAYAGEPAIDWIGTDGKPYDSAPAIRITASLNRPAAEALFAGAPRSLAAVFAEAAREGGKPKGFALGQPVAIERGSTTRKFSSPNVIGMIPGSDPALADEVVMLTAHLDHEGVDPEREGDKIYNGAMDNAAGIATMLEVARAMASAPERPRRTVMFAAVTAEEDGLLGSQYLAKHPVSPGKKLVGVVNLDMPVLLYEFADMIAFGAEHSTLGPIVERATESAGVTLSPDPMPEQGIFTRSDHYRFVQEGVPAVMLMTGFANGGEKIWGEFFATHYHLPSDEIDLPFNWEAAAKFARINYLIAREIANAPEAPRWYAGDFFGDTFAPKAEKAPAP
jgi:hypothetical protein